MNSKLNSQLNRLSTALFCFFSPLFSRSLSAIIMLFILLTFCRDDKGNYSAPSDVNAVSSLKVSRDILNDGFGANRFEIAPLLQNAQAFDSTLPMVVVRTTAQSDEPVILESESICNPKGRIYSLCEAVVRFEMEIYRLYGVQYGGQIYH